MPTTIAAAALLPASLALRVDILCLTADGITVTLTSTQPTAACPLCQAPSVAIHSRYRRTLADLPWGRVPVRLDLHVRTFFCRTPACARRIFTERLPTIAAPHARRTSRLAAALRLVALALGGEAGARVVAGLVMGVSPDALLRLIQTAPLPQREAPRVLGIDDWSWRRGHRFGTILVDLERQCPVDLLPDRAVETVVDWLKAHPGVAVISRDRAQCYAEAARQGAPDAVQVADRWHLLKNLAEALERCLLRYASSRKAAAQHPADRDPPLQSCPDADRVPWEQRTEEDSRAKHQATLERYQRIRDLHTAGADIAAIARSVGVSRVTVYRYLQLTAPPERKHSRRRQQVLDPYKAYLLQRWDAGCHVKLKLFREIQTQGYACSPANVFRFLNRTLRARSRDPAQTVPPPASAVPTARQVAGLFVARPERLKRDEQAYLSRLTAGEPSLATAYALTQAFGQMLRERQGEQLANWLTEAKDSGIKELAAYARGLEGDAAVQAGLTLAWSNGQTEGQVHRLKLLKRQSYGRAGFDLLRRRVLLAA